MRATLGLIVTAAIVSLVLPSIAAQAQTNEMRSYQVRPAGKQN